MFRYISRLLARGTTHQLSPQHVVALDYWKNCSNSFLANPEYYERCEVELRQSVLPRVGRVERLLDAGCGNGRFTFVFAEAASMVDAYDVSSALIGQAREAAKSRGAKNINFRVEDIARAKWAPSSYDVASCMGVLSTIIDEPIFLAVARKLRAAARPGGFMLLRDTVSLLPEGELVQSDTYAIRYRHENHYRQTLANLGMTLEYEAPLIEEGKLVNRIYLYRLHSSPAL